MKKLILLPFILLIIPQLQAQPIPNNTAAKILDKNKVKANINTVNNKFWNIYGNGKAAYEVPVGKATHAQFCNSVWVGGLDNNNLLHISANTYRQSGVDFWPGPLDTANIAAYVASNTAVYNKLWKVDCNDIAAFANAFSQGWVANNTYTVPPDILTWPAKGIGNFQKNMAPFMDMNFDGKYDPKTDGDYPIIKGHQQILSIFNDTLRPHTETQGAAMGLEFYERAYAYSDPGIVDSMQAINFTTFYHYTIINRSSNNYYNVYLTDWSDVDLGYYMDDYIGTDSLNNFTYCYNSTANDPTGLGVKGYGSRPPVVCHAIMPTTGCAIDGVDNDGDLIIDEPGEQFQLDRTTYYNNNLPGFPVATTNPGPAQEFYNYMTGFWKDNSPFAYGGNAYGGINPHKMVYTGNPQTNTGWTEATASNLAGDRRVLSTSGPFNFPAGSKIEWAYAIVFSQDTTANTNTISQFNSRVRRDVRNIRYYDETHQGPQCAPQLTITTGVNNLKTPVFDALVYPNPATDILQILLLNKSDYAQIRLFDLTGRMVEYGEIKNSDRTRMYVSGLEPGAYVLEITDGSSKLCRKLIRN